MTGSVVFVESNTTGTGALFLRRAREAGLAPVLVTADPGRYGFGPADGVEVVRADTGDQQALEGVVGELCDRERVLAVLSSSEYYLETAASLARSSGLAAADPAAVARCRDKRRQHEALAAAGVPVAEQVVAHTEEEALEAGRALGYPLVCKPRSGSGSVGVRLCSDPTELVAQARRLLGQTTNERGLAMPPGTLVESFVPGREYSVEIIAGEVAAVVGKHLGPAPSFVEVGHDFPAQIGEEEERELWRLALAAVEALGLDGAPAVHVEARVQDRARIIEVNARLAGGCIPVLIAYASGFDPVAATLQAALGRRPSRPCVPTGHAALRFLVVARPSLVGDEPVVGRLARAAGVVEARMYRPRGSRVAPAGDFRDRVGHVIAVGRFAHQARAACRRQVDRMARSLVPLPAG